MLLLGRFARFCVLSAHNRADPLPDPGLQVEAQLAGSGQLMAALIVPWPG